MRRHGNAPIASFAALLLGCGPDLGVCDEPAAEAVVYDDGVPAFEGQALVIQSCGSGGFCHSEGIEADERRGAPRGMDLDLRLAAQSPDVDEAELERLARAQQNVYYHRELVFESVESGRMPPDATDVPIGRPEYQRVPEGMREGPALPSIASDEGLRVFRNWLACGAPVVERTLPRADGNDNSVGETVATIETTPVEPTWGAIYDRIVARSCAFVLCHDAETAAGALDLSTPAIAHAALLSPAAGRLCGPTGATRVVPGDPEASLLIHKLRGVAPEGRLCGSRMPSAGSHLSASRVETLEAWIRDGARPD